MRLKNRRDDIVQTGGLRGDQALETADRRRAKPKCGKAFTQVDRQLDPGGGQGDSKLDMLQASVHQLAELGLSQMTLRHTKHRQHRLAVQSPQEARGI